MNRIRKLLIADDDEDLRAGRVQLLDLLDDLLGNTFTDNRPSTPGGLVTPSSVTVTVVEALTVSPL